MSLSLDEGKVLHPEHSSGSVNPRAHVHHATMPGVQLPARDLVNQSFFAILPPLPSVRSAQGGGKHRTTVPLFLGGPFRNRRSGSTRGHIAGGSCGGETATLVNNGAISRTYQERHCRSGPASLSGGSQDAHEAVSAIWNEFKHLSINSRSGGHIRYERRLSRTNSTAQPRALTVPMSKIVDLAFPRPCGDQHIRVKLRHGLQPT